MMTLLYITLYLVVGAALIVLAGKRYWWPMSSYSVRESHFDIAFCALLWPGVLLIWILFLFATICFIPIDFFGKVIQAIVRRVG